MNWTRYFAKLSFFTVTVIGLLSMLIALAAAIVHAICSGVCPVCCGCAVRATRSYSSRSRRPWGERSPDRATWYQPLEDPRAIGLAVHWVLGRPDFFLNTAGDVDLLPRVLDEAARFQGRPTEEEMRLLVEDQAMTPLFS